MDFYIRYWNLGAEELYGWKAEDAMAKHSIELLRTVHPIPLDDLLAGDSDFLAARTAGAGV